MISESSRATMRWLAQVHWQGTPQPQPQFNSYAKPKPKPNIHNTANCGCACISSSAALEDVRNAGRITLRTIPNIGREVKTIAGNEIGEQQLGMRSSSLYMSWTLHFQLSKQLAPSLTQPWYQILSQPSSPARADHITVSQTIAKESFTREFGPRLTLRTIPSTGRELKTIPKDEIFLIYTLQTLHFQSPNPQA